MFPVFLQELGIPSMLNSILHSRENCQNIRLLLFL